MDLALHLIHQHPTHRPRFESVLISLLNPIKGGTTELITYLMHDLRWSVVQNAIARHLATPANVSYPRQYAAMLDAFTDTWRDRDMYRRYNPDRGAHTH
ncbi:hypothetical protein ACIA49_19125 [Kribbella sp. NPDC051587]|uniref:hypothetical protein n=1 Tax=Kribbella sp. NPDC051587 TaxID=3364119 RepID=UPI003795D460